MTELEEIGSRIRTIRKRSALSMKELGKKVGLSESMIWRYEKGDLKSVDMVMIKKIANALDTEASELLGWKESSTALDPVGVRPIPQELFNIPKIGTIRGGEPIMCDQQFETVQAAFKADFCLDVTGSSMKGAGIYDGDIVFCRKQEMVENGEIAAVIIDDTATLKRFYNYGDTIVLMPDNPDFKEMVYSGDEMSDIRIIGKAVSTLHPVH